MCSEWMSCSRSEKRRRVSAHCRMVSNWVGSLSKASVAPVLMDKTMSLMAEDGGH
jgi:hypothetical protein